MDNPFASLEKLFHEPARLAITTMLVESETGCTFVELKAACELTDGNLNRHLKALHDAGAIESIRLREGVSCGRPQTTIRLTDSGRAGYLAYLQVLEEVLRKAADALHVSDRPVPAGVFSLPAKI